MTDPSYLRSLATDGLPPVIAQALREAADEIEGLRRMLEDARVRIIELTRENNRLKARQPYWAKDDTDAIAF